MSPVLPAVPPSLQSPLYPRASETRELLCLDGVWSFRVDLAHQSRAASWEKSPLRAATPMPVPASINELTSEVRVRDHVGWFWYERSIHVPAGWADRSLWLRFGAIWHRALVWLDGQPITSHVGGYLPFEAEVSAFLIPGNCHRLTIAVSNELDYTALPHGEVLPPSENAPRRLRIHGDVYPHAGIHRSIWLSALPRARLTDFTLRTRLAEGGRAVVSYAATHTGADDNRLTLTLRTPAGELVAEQAGSSGEFVLAAPQLWSPASPTLYEVQLSLADSAGRRLDVYRQPVGLRTVAVAAGQFLLNGQPFVFRGFGKTEDVPWRGKAYDPVLALRDLQLLRWVGANSIRTGHHPFAEEFLQLADQLGIAVIEEAAALSIWIPDTDNVAKNASPLAATRTEWRPDAAPQNATPAPGHAELYAATFADHQLHLREMIARDKNHACIFLWSLGNEIDTTQPQSRPYFSALAALVRAADPTRPLTLVECMPCDETRVGDLADIISVNRYYGWYSDPGDLEVIAPELTAELTRWYARHRKPILLAEFGADAIAGLHQDPPTLFTEEYQAELIARYLTTCSELPFVVGTHVWTFTDFLTAQGVKRVDGNKKGVFTRERRPKLAAHRLRALWAVTVTPAQS
jgi:beta-glucuronidase